MLQNTAVCLCMNIQIFVCGYVRLYQIELSVELIFTSNYFV